MKYTIDYLNPENLFIIKTNGDMTGKDFVDMAEGILSHPDHRPNGKVIFDHRKLNFNNVPLEDIEQIRDFHRKNENKIGNGKSAIVVKSQAEWDNIWKQGEKINTENIVKIFDDFNDAIKWIKN